MLINQNYKYKIESSLDLVNKIRERISPEEYDLLSKLVERSEEFEVRKSFVEAQMDQVLKENSIANPTPSEIQEFRDKLLIEQHEAELEAATLEESRNPTTKSLNLDQFEVLIAPANHIVPYTRK
jgi:hypothetical protein